MRIRPDPAASTDKRKIITAEAFYRRLARGPMAVGEARQSFGGGSGFGGSVVLGVRWFGVRGSRGFGGSVFSSVVRGTQLTPRTLEPRTFTCYLRRFTNPTGRAAAADGGSDDAPSCPPTAAPHPRRRRRRSVMIALSSPTSTLTGLVVQTFLVRPAAPTVGAVTSPHDLLVTNAP